MWISFERKFFVKSFKLFIAIQGHRWARGGGGGGCTHAWRAKIARHPAWKKQGGGAPRGAKHPGEKKFWPPGEAIFWDFLAKSPPGVLNKHPTEKNFSPPGGGAGEKIFRPPKAAGKFFWGHPPVSTPPLSQNPCPPMFVKQCYFYGTKICSFANLMEFASSCCCLNA